MKNSILSFVCLSFLVAIISTVNAQQFYTALESLSGDAIVETMDGQTIEGKITVASLGPKGLTSIRIKNAETGKGESFKAEQVKSLKVKMDRRARMETLDKQTANLSKWSSSNFNEKNEREYIYYEQVEWPDKKGKYLLVQQLNTGWDSKIKVYDYPAKKTGETKVGGMAVSGGDAKAYIVSYKGETYIVDKKNYEKEFFPKFYSDCSLFDDTEDKEKKFTYFAGHVFKYDQECEGI